MDTNILFEQALGLGGKWKVSKNELDTQSRQLKVWLDFDRGTHFACPQCEALCPVHDTTEKHWRHLDFWQHQTELIARVPRIECEEHGVLLASVPWAREGSGFTLMMEGIILLLCQQMSVSAAAAYMGETDQRLWRILEEYVNKAHAAKDWSKVCEVMVDETSIKKGHRYVTNFIAGESKELLFTVEGRGIEAMEAFAREMLYHGAKPSQVTTLVMDMSKSYIAGAGKYFPQAEIVFDHFHIMQMAGKALDEVRKELQREGAELKGSLWAIRGNEWTRSEEQLEERKRCAYNYPKLGRALSLRESLQDILSDHDVGSLKWWCSWASRSRLKPFQKLARSIKSHWGGIISFMKTRLTNALMEAVNGKLQLAKRIARGFRNFCYFRTVAYLKAGKLPLNAPTL